MPGVAGSGLVLATDRCSGSSLSRRARGLHDKQTSGRNRVLRVRVTQAPFPFIGIVALFAVVSYLKYSEIPSCSTFGYLTFFPSNHLCTPNLQVTNHSFTLHDTDQATMRWSFVLLGALSGLDAAWGHDSRPHMNMVGPHRRGVEELRRRRTAFEPWNPPTAANKPRGHHAHHLSPRQASASPIPVGDNSRCGGTYGRCADGYCCSAEGYVDHLFNSPSHTESSKLIILNRYCGQTADYCNSPDCLINYGPACDGNKKPSGADTSNDARPLKGNVPYGGVGIYNCVNDGDVAITYDDGPYLYTAAMLDAFKAHGAVATFFITGNNIGKGMINVAYPDVIRVSFRLRRWAIDAIANLPSAWLLMAIRLPAIRGPTKIWIR